MSHRICHSKPKSGVWLHFSEFSEDGVKKVRCQLCPQDKKPWVSVPNATRMDKHLREEHKTLVKPEVAVSHGPASSSCSASAEVPALASQATPVERPQEAAQQGGPKMKKAKLSDYFDRPFSAPEQEASERAQALMVVMNAHSYNSQNSAWTHDFFRSLRADYVPPSAYILEKHVRTLHEQIQGQVMATLKCFTVVSLAVDGWTDHQNFAALAFTAVVPDGRALLLKFERIWERETGKYISSAIKSVIAGLKEDGVTVSGVVADNAKNMQKGIELTLPDNVIQLNCVTHSLNLLIKDLAGLFKNQFDQSAQTEEFFRNRHEPHVAYEKARETLKGTMLISRAETRWASQIACVGSLLKNRQVVENAVLQLRSQKYAFKGTELMWIWATDWWNTLEGIHKAFEPLQSLIEVLQSDKVSLGRAVEFLLPVLKQLPESVKLFAPGDFAAASRLINERSALFFRAEAVIANIFHHRCRGAALPAELRSAALQKVVSVAEAINVQPPEMQELMDYMQCRGQFAGVSSLDCRSFDVWSSLFPKSSLSSIGRMFGALPCSQNSCERVFSAADWAAENRERLGFEKLATEVYVRFNKLRLSAL